MIDVQGESRRYGGVSSNQASNASYLLIEGERSYADLNYTDPSHNLRSLHKLPPRFLCYLYD